MGLSSGFPGIKPIKIVSACSVIHTSHCTVIVVNDKSLENEKDSVNSQLNHCLVAEDTIIIAHPELVCFQNCRNGVFSSLSRWFKARKLTLNLDKSHNEILY
jgi:hypothetical protein